MTGKTVAVVVLKRNIVIFILRYVYLVQWFQQRKTFTQHFHQLVVAAVKTGCLSACQQTQERAHFHHKHIPPVF